MKSGKNLVHRNAKGKMRCIRKGKKRPTDMDNNKMTNEEKIWWEEISQIDWFPIDPYSD